jgi:hypothetical protein
VEPFYDCTLPAFNINPPNTDCVVSNRAGTTCTNTYSGGTMVTITAPASVCGELVCWRGACFGNSNKPGSSCTLTMDTDKAAGVLLAPDCTGITTDDKPVGLAWNIDLDVPGAIGQAVVDGQVVVTASGQRAQQSGRSREGDAVVAATLIKAGQPGTWRFEAQPGESIEAGSLRVLQGDVVLLTPTAVVFRLKGDAGERVSFSYRLRR